MLKAVCTYIQENDRNSDILDAYKEYRKGELPYRIMLDIVHMILSDWKQDLEYTGMTPQEQQFYAWIGL